MLRSLPPLEEESRIVDLAGLITLPVKVQPAKERADVPPRRADRKLPRPRTLRAAVAEHQVDPLLPPLPFVQLVRHEERGPAAVVGPGDGGDPIQPPGRAFRQDFRVPALEEVRERAMLNHRLRRAEQRIRLLERGGGDGNVRRGPRHRPAGHPGPLPAVEHHRAGELSERKRRSQLRLAVSLADAEERAIVAPAPVRLELVGAVDKRLLPRPEPERLAEIVALRMDQEPLDPPTNPRPERRRGLRA